MASRPKLTEARRLRALIAKIVIEEERHRRALAVELHNGLGQEIALTKLEVSMLRKSAGAQLQRRMRKIERLIADADRALRSILFRISPPSLHDLGLVEALQWLAEDFSQRYAIPVRFEDDNSPRVTDEGVRVILFRSVRELLINAATHAKAREVFVRVSGQLELVRISVEDSGSGFDAREVERRGYGLFGIREQLRQIDGKLQIDSTPAHGTLVTLTAPSCSLKARLPQCP